MRRGWTNVEAWLSWEGMDIMGRVWTNVEGVVMDVVG